MHLKGAKRDQTVWIYSMDIHADFGFRILDMCKVPLCLR